MFNPETLHTSVSVQGKLTVREKVLRDMSHRIYMEPKEHVLAEINRILSLNILFPEETKQVNELKKKIEKDTEYPPLQFNCGDPNVSCDWGG